MPDDLIRSDLFRGVCAGDYQRLLKTGVVTPPKPIGGTFAEALSRAGEWQYVVDHVLGYATGAAKRYESFSFTRKDGIRFATDRGSHAGWLLYAPFVRVCGGQGLGGRGQSGAPWLYHSEKIIWVLSGCVPPPKEVGDLYKSGAEYEREYREGLETLPAFEERKRRERQLAQDRFVEYTEVNWRATRDDEILLVYGSVSMAELEQESIPASAFHVE
jgi:hypothetical protein